MLDGTGVSGCKSQDLLPLSTSCDYLGLNDQVIEELNMPFSRWLSKVASTGFSLLVFHFSAAFPRTDVLSSQYTHRSHP